MRPPSVFVREPSAQEDERLPRDDVAMRRSRFRARAGTPSPRRFEFASHFKGPWKTGGGEIRPDRA
jgi:hypothetical protein